MAPPGIQSPPPPSPPPLHHFAVDACPLQLVKDHAKCLAQGTHRAAVRCCLQGSGFRSSHCGVSVCAYDDLDGNLASAPITDIDGAAATYAEAATECMARNMRLCSVSELSDCCGHGCARYDETKVWSLSTCYPSHNPAADAEHWVADELSPITHSAVVESLISRVSWAVSSGSSAIQHATGALSARIDRAFAAVERALSALVAASPAMFEELQKNGKLLLLIVVGIMAVVVMTVKCLSCLHDIRQFARRKFGRPLAADIRRYQRLDDRKQGVSPSHRSVANSGSCERTTNNGRLSIKPPLPLELLRAGARGHAPPSGMEGMRPGLSASRRHDGTKSGLYAGMGEGTSTRTHLPPLS